jgi:hypothetical protein
MKWCIFSFCNLAAIACSGHAMAEENVCVELARTIGLNYQNYLDVDQQQAVAKADLCSDNYSSASTTKQAQLQASYKVFSGSASASDAEVQVAQSHYCEARFGAYWRNQIKTGEARTVSEEGAAVITNCIELTNKGLFPSLTIANGGQDVALSVQYKPDVVSDIKIKQFGPSDVTKASCTITKEGSTLHMAKITDAAQTLHPADSVLLTCLRELQDKNIDGVTYRCTNETIFSIATSGTTKSIKMPKICNQTIEESRADKLEKQIKQIDDQLAKLKADNAGELKNIKSLLPGPADFYVKPIPSIVQESQQFCDGDDILISAACTNSLGAQAAVGPKFFEKDGKLWASCERYNTPGQTAEGQLICMKHH